MKKKGICKLTSAVLMMAMIVSLLLIPGIPAQCATAKLTKLSADKVYTNFDLTGDGKKDRFKIQRTKEKEKGHYRRFEISVNGKKAHTYTCIYQNVYTHLNPTLISLSNGMKYLFISCRNKDTHRSLTTEVLQYKDGEFEQVIDFNEYCKRHCHTWKAWPKSVKGNKINFGVSMESTETKGYYTGNLVMQFVYKDGTLKQNGSAAHVDKDYAKFIIDKNTWTYLAPDMKHTCYKLLAGDIVLADACRISSKRLLMRVRRGNVKAWMLFKDGVMGKTLYKEDLK